MSTETETPLARAERRIREHLRGLHVSDSALFDPILADIKEANRAYELLLRATQFQHEYYTDVAKKRKLGLAENALFDAAKVAMEKANLP